MRASSSCATLRDADGRLLRTFNRGAGASSGAYLEDHAFLLEALLTLYEATFDARWFAAARELAETLIERFADPEHGGFLSTPPDHGLIARRKDLEDAPIPSGGSAAAFGLLRLAALTGEHALAEAALGVLALLHEAAPRYPTAFGHRQGSCLTSFVLLRASSTSTTTATSSPSPARRRRRCPASSPRRRPRSRVPAGDHRGRHRLHGRARSRALPRSARRRRGDDVLKGRSVV